MGQRVAVIGSGYVGLTTAAVLAHLGHDVLCADIDATKVAMLSRGRIPIHEPGLEEMVGEELGAGRLRFVLDAANAVPGRQFVFMCLPTPQGVDGAADMSFVEAAAQEISSALDPGAIVINKSTVPVGSARLVGRWIGRYDVSVVSNPEFLREGTAVEDAQNPDRIVIGSDDRGAAERVAQLYEDVDAPVLITDTLSAETIKYVANAFLATKLSFANSVAGVCEAVGANVDDVLRGVSYDHRVGPHYFKPGPGWGGSCFPKDTRALVRIADDAGYDLMLLRRVIKANKAQYNRVVQKVERAAGGSLAGTRVGALGLAFKAGTDDTRESPALHVIRRLVRRGAVVRAYDPVVRTTPLLDVEVLPDPYAACDGADVVVVLTEWEEFVELDLDRLAETVNRRAVVDTRNILDPQALYQRGFTYEGIGRL